jgi:hypothetical protein
VGTLCVCVTGPVRLPSLTMTTLATSSNAKAVTRLDVCRRCTAPAHIHTQSTRMVNVHLTPHTHTTHTDLRRHCSGRVRVRVCVDMRDREGRARRAHTGGRWRPCIHARVGAQQILAWVRSDREKRCKPAPSPTRSLLLNLYLDKRLHVTWFVYRLQELISALSLSLCVCRGYRSRRPCTALRGQCPSQGQGPRE